MLDDQLIITQKGKSSTMVKKLNEEQFDSIFLKGRNEDRIQPSQQVWERLDDKLELFDNRKKKRIYRNWAFAASFLVLITAGLFFTHYMDQHDRGIFRTNGEDTSLYMEDLGFAENHLADISNVAKLYDAYQSFETKAQILTRDN